MRCWCCSYVPLGEAVALVTSSNGNQIPTCRRDLDGLLDLADAGEVDEPAGLVFMEEACAGEAARTASAADGVPTVLSPLP